MANANYHQHTQHQFGQHGLGNNLPGGSGGGGGGGHDPPNGQGNNPGRAHYADMRPQAALSMMKMAGVREYHTQCLNCLEQQDPEHRQNWLHCPNPCPFCPADQQHRDSPCRKWLSLANYEWCMVHGGQVMNRFITPSKKERAHMARHAQHTGPPQSDGNYKNAGYQPNLQPRPTPPPMGGENYYAGYQPTPTPMGGGNYYAGYQPTPTPMSGGNYNAVYQPTPTPMGGGNYYAGYQPTPTPMGGGNYNVGYQQNPQLPQTPTGGWNYNNAGYQQNPQPLQTLMEGGNYNNNAGYQAPGQHEVQQDYEREQRPNPNRHRVRGLRPDPSQARDGKRDFNNYNSDHQNAGRESAHQFRSPAYRQRAENRGRRRYHESQSHHNAPPPTGAHPSPAPSENTGGTGPTQAQIDALMQQVNELREQLNSTRRDVVEQKSRHETTEGTVGEAVNHLRGISNNDSNTPPYPLKQEMDDVHVDLMAIEPIVNTSLPNEDSQAFLILPNVAAQNEPANADNQNPMFNFRANSEAPSTNFSDTPSSTALVEPKSYGKTPGDKSGGRKRRKQ